MERRKSSGSLVEAERDADRTRVRRVLEAYPEVFDTATVLRSIRSDEGCFEFAHSLPRWIDGLQPCVTAWPECPGEISWRSVLAVQTLARGLSATALLRACETMLSVQPVLEGGRMGKIRWDPAEFMPVVLEATRLVEAMHRMKPAAALERSS
jgi:hypothetical protein